MIKTILLTGPTGFLGSHLLEALKYEGYTVVILKRSFSDTWRIDHLLGNVKSYDIDRTSFEKAFEEQKIDAVIHTATSYGRKNEKVSEVVDTNLTFGLKILETAVFYHTNVFFNTDTLQYKYLSNYTLAKKQFAEWLKFFSETGKINIVNMRLEHMYGPKDDRSKFVFWLLEQMLSNTDEIPLTNGDQKRDFIYITDIVNAYLLLLQQSEKTRKFSEYDVGTGNPISIKEFVLKVKGAVEKVLKNQVTTELRFGSLPYRKGEMMVIEEDVTPLFDLGWRPTTGLTDGLESVVTEFIERRKNQ
jgi:nucleoside-diphosphate-sugar epimerase